MNKCQRKHFANTEKPIGYDDIQCKARADKSLLLCDKIVMDAMIEVVFPPRTPRQLIMEKPLLNRCSWVSPELRSFSPLTGNSDYSTVGDISSQDAFPRSPQQRTETNSMRKLKYDMRKVIYVSQVNKNERKQIICDSWSHNNNNPDDYDKLVTSGSAQNKVTLTQYHSLPKNFYISDNPQVKTIAEMFRIYKKNNIELRKLEERVVCFEYDVIDRERGVTVQKMRVFFSLNPKVEDEENVLKEIKQMFTISATDIHKLSQKQVEIIDEKIYENKSYLEDLRKILRRKQTSGTQDRRALNLQSLYETAKRELLESHTDCDANVLSKEEMEEIEKLILIHCKSSVHGIRKTTIAHTKSSDNHVRDSISRSLINEVMKEEWHNYD